MTDGLNGELKLSDAISLCRGFLDSTHKFWGYFQVLAAGTAGFAWTHAGKRDVQLWLCLVFGCFAIVNGYLVIDSQSSAFLTKRAIASHVSATGGRGLDSIVNELRPSAPLNAAVWHAILTAATLLSTLYSSWPSPREWLAMGPLVFFPCATTLLGVLYSRKRCAMGWTDIMRELGWASNRAHARLTGGQP